MTNTIREPRDSDFFPWLSVYERYTAARGVELTEQKALLLWTWLTDAAHPESALVSLDESGEVTAFAHFHTFPRPLAAETGVFIDALYSADAAHAEAQTAELLAAVRATAAARGASVIRWTRSDGEEVPAALSSAAGEPENSAVYELQASTQRA